MRLTNIIYIVLLFLISHAKYSSLIGQEKLELEGAIVLSNSESLNPVSGTLRFNTITQQFEGYNGYNWISLSVQLPDNTILLSESRQNSELESLGYVFDKEISLYEDVSKVSKAPEDSWLKMSEDYLQGSGGVSVWTGDRAFFWGGSYRGIYNTVGGLYDPIEDNWILTSNNGAPLGRSKPICVWTGDEVILWGGYTYRDGSFTYYNDGAKYNPTTDTWTSMSTVGAPTGRNGAASAVIGNKMVVWGGSAASPLNTGAIYDIAENRWEAMNIDNAPIARHEVGFDSDDDNLYVFGGFVGGDKFNTAYRFNLEDNEWSKIPNVGSAPSGRSGAAVNYFNDQLTVFGGVGESGSLSDGYSYSFIDEEWTALSSPDFSVRSSFSVKSNGKIFAFDRSSTTIKKYEPSTDMWIDISYYPYSAQRNSPIICNSANGFMIWGGEEYGAVGESFLYFKNGERYFDDAGQTVAIRTKVPVVLYQFKKM